MQHNSNGWRTEQRQSAILQLTDITQYNTVRRAKAGKPQR